MDNILNMDKSYGAKMVSNFKIENMSLHTKQVSISSSLFKSISSSRILPQFRVSFLSITRLHCLSLSSSSFPLSNPEIPTEHSFKVRYVIYKFGWPLKFAISNTKYINFETPEKPERVLAFLKKHGFSKPQISRLVKVRVQTLCCNPEKTLLPKLKFLSNLGFSETEITDVVTKVPEILKRSLEKTVIPNFNLISKLLNSNDEAVTMVKRYPTLFTANLELENIQILLEAGVPAAKIIASTGYRWKGCKLSPESFRKLVEEVKQMGFDPCHLNFIWALQNFSLLSKSSLKVEILKKYGWSDNDILLAYEKNPKFLECTKDKIDQVMDFLVNRMGTEATDVANWPVIFTYSLKKRIIPRCLVYQSMVENGLCKKKYKIRYLCNLSEHRFLAMIIEQCEDQAPELLDFYNEMMGMKNMT